MNKITRKIGIIGILLLSFYYTDKVAEYVKTNNPIYDELTKVDNKLIPSIDSIITEEYIIPGLNGKKLNIDKSFYNMHKYNSYSEELLVYDEVKPNISLEDNKNKIIIQGNCNKNEVSIIFDSISDISEYMIENNYHINLLIYEEEYNKNYEMINNSNIETKYNNIEKYLNKNKINTNICYITSKIPTYCNDKYLIKPTIIISHSNISSAIKKITNGSIIKIENSISKDELKVILEQIRYLNLNVVTLSNLISETN